MDTVDGAFVGVISEEGAAAEEVEVGVARCASGFDEVGLKLLARFCEVEIEAALPGGGHVGHPGRLPQLDAEENFRAIGLELDLAAGGRVGEAVDGGTDGPLRLHRQAPVDFVITDPREAHEAERGGARIEPGDAIGIGLLQSHVGIELLDLDLLGLEE